MGILDFSDTDKQFRIKQDLEDYLLSGQLTRPIFKILLSDDKKSISNFTFRDMHFSGKIHPNIFRETGLKEITFNRCTFSSMDFSGAEFSTVEIENCTFIDCIFDGVKFKDCKFLASHFKRCTNAKFESGEIVDCDFSGTDLSFS